jgi:hypothetical protein
LAIYISTVYLTDTLNEKTGKLLYEPNIPLLWVMGFFLLYPVWNDGNQLLKHKLAYFITLVNYVDILQIIMGYYSIFNQINMKPDAIRSKSIMIVNIFTCLIKTFFYMRVVKSFSFIVTMLVNVIKDLLVFMLFFAILVTMFSLVFGIVAANHSPEYH